MPIIRSLDSSLKERITNPSRDFSDFLNQYFLTPQIYMRGEYDPTILDRLKGNERDTAIQMIISNLRSGRTHLVDSAVRLDLKSVIPILESMRADDYDELERYIIERALYLLDAIDLYEFFSVTLAAIETFSEFTAFVVVTDAYRLLPKDKAREIIDAGLRRGDYSTRASAFNAAVALQYIASHGGSYGESLGSDLWKMEMAAATQGAPHPMYYEQLQYYVGDAVYGNSSVFEQRIRELWNPTERKMPLYTEIHRKV